MNPKEQHILFILDRSGSMSSQQSDVIGGFNTYIAEMRAEAAVDGMATVVSLVTFADNNSVIFASKPVAEVSPLTESNYRTMGSTALLDAVHSSVSKYREKLGQGAFSVGNSDCPAVLVVIFTDGEENASTSTSWSQVQSLIKECEELGNWTFTYVGAHSSAWSQADHLNMRRGNTIACAGVPFMTVTDHLVRSAREHRYAYRDYDRKASDELFAEEKASGDEVADTSA